MMKSIFIIILLQLTFCGFSQNGGFEFDEGVDKVKIPFKLINNLIFIPVKINGVELNLLLDSGVEETILFSLEDKQVNVYNTQKISLRGLGSQEAIEGLKSTNNTLTVSGMKSSNHVLYIILDQSFNLSSHIGIPVNGIIGYQFFRNNIVEINYASKKVIVYKDVLKYKNRVEKNFTSVPITIERSKPYIVSSVFMNEKEVSTKLLIDIGNSDAVWLFQNFSKDITVPKKSFKDYLGKGFSGDIEGDRARIKRFELSKFKFENPIVAFPDSSSIKNVRLVPNRVGSVGAEILKRFTVVFDYTNAKMYLKKNIHYNSPFTYNKSGVEVQHYGLQWVEGAVRLETMPIAGVTIQSNGAVAGDFKFKFELKPVYEIASVRRNSPAAVSGLLKGDIIKTINRNPAYNYSLQKINSILKSEDEDWITLEVERGKDKLKFRFQLIDEL